jgi:hypothetical protein
MATHDYVIDNQTSANARADINNVLQAILSNNSSATAPTVTAANMFWYDTANNVLKMRNEADTAWIIVGYLDQSGSKFEVRTDVIQAASGSGTSVKNSSGTTIIDLSVASQSTAEAGTNNTQVMTPLRTSQAIAALADTGLKHVGTTEPGSNTSTITVSGLGNYSYVKVGFLLNITSENSTYQPTFKAGGTSTRSLITLEDRMDLNGPGADTADYARSYFGTVEIMNFNNGQSGIGKPVSMVYSRREDEVGSNTDAGGEDLGTGQNLPADYFSAISTRSEAWSFVQFTTSGTFRGSDSSFVTVWGI